MTTTITTTIIATVQIDYTSASVIRSVARKDMPEYGLTEGQVFYMIRSSKNDGSYYISTWNYERIGWECRCPATCYSCRHTRLIAKDCGKAHSLQGYRPVSKAETFAGLVALYDVRNQPVATAVAIIGATGSVVGSVTFSKQERRTAALSSNRAFSFMR